MNKNPPDPAWDYAVVWAWASQVEANLKQLVDLMEISESANAETDALLARHFENIELAARSARSLFAQAR